MSVMEEVGFTAVEASNGEGLSGWRLEFEFFSRWRDEGISHRIEFH
jgi:hypothetical protein